MKLAGLLLLASGWVIVLSAITALPPGSYRAAFAIAGFGVELIGLAIAIVGHIPPVKEKR